MFSIVEQYLKFNRPGTPLLAKGAILHETANPGDSAETEFDFFNSGYQGASAHAFVDEGKILATVPWNEMAWHAGPTANKGFWGIELCHTQDPVKFQSIWRQATWLFAYLFVKIAVPPIHIVTHDNLLSHNEASLRWKETDHTDPDSYFSRFGKTVNDFRMDVQKQIDQLKVGGTTKMSVDEALEVLHREGIINSPDYWVSALKVVNHLDTLLIQVANFILKK